MKKSVHWSFGHWRPPSKKKDTLSIVVPQGSKVHWKSDGKSWGIYGCNGAGKSSFVDSIEYGINGGKIGHLVSEYSGRNQEKAGARNPGHAKADECRRDDESEERRRA